MSKNIEMVEKMSVTNVIALNRSMSLQNTCPRVSIERKECGIRDVNGIKTAQIRGGLG